METIELNHIYNEDCLIGMQRIYDESVDSIICDPPYMVSRDSNFASSEPTGKDTDRFRISIDFCEWDTENAFDIDAMIRQSYRVLKNGGSIVCFYDLWKITQLKGILTHTGFNQIMFIEWINNNPVPINSNVNYLTNAREIAVCAVKGSNPTFNSKYDNGIYYEDICHDEDRFHPTQKPLTLIRRLVLKHTNEGDTILDNCIGSGTTAIACIREHRNFIGFELNKEYYEKANERIAKELLQTKLF